MNPLLTVQYNTGITLTIPNQLVYSSSTYFSKDQPSGQTTVTVLNGLDFTATTGVVLLGALGSEYAERRVLGASVAAGSLQLASATSFAHNRGEVINQIAYDQVVIETATSSTGSFSVLATIDFAWTGLNTLYQHTAGTTATYYRIKYLNSATSVASPYSNGGVGVSSATFDSTTMAALINSVRSSVGNTTKSDQFFIDQLNDARKILNEEFGYGRVNEWRQQFDYPLQMLAGRSYIDLPADIEVNTTNRYVLNARYSRQSVAANLPLKYVDKRSFNTYNYQNRYTTLTTAANSGATTLVFDRTNTTYKSAGTGDLPASGTIFAATDDPSQSIITITYTANNVSTGTLTGVSGVTRNLPAGCQIWAYPTFTYAYWFTVYDGKMWLDKPIPAALQGKNMYIDYYKKLVDINYTSDTIPEPYRDIYKNYMRFAIKRTRDDQIGTDDEDYKRFIAAANNVLGNPYTGQDQIVIQG